MSFEGHYELLCPNGHFWSEDWMTFSYGTVEEVAIATKCTDCNLPFCWYHRVDETNGCEGVNPEGLFIHQVDCPCGWTPSLRGTGVRKIPVDKGRVVLRDYRGKVEQEVQLPDEKFGEGSEWWKLIVTT